MGGGYITDRKLTVASVPSIEVLQASENDDKYEMVKLKSTYRNEKNKTGENSKHISTKKSCIFTGKYSGGGKWF